MIGQIINDRFQIDDLLGRGGMGAVYRAIDLKQNRLVALKFLNLYGAGNTEAALTRFQREFRVLTRLDHPRIMRAYEFGTHLDTPYLVLEFLAGRTLADEMGAAPLPRAYLLQIARQICEALAYLHNQSIVHRDLKPGNLMLLTQNEPLAPVEKVISSKIVSRTSAGAPTSVDIKLMDFGLVRQTDLSIQLTQQGVALGTVAYMAPEHAQGFPVDFRMDLYSLGVILYEMATGQTPFQHKNPAMLLMALLTSSPVSPRQINPDLDEGLEQLIMQLIAKEPSQRPGSAELLAVQLTELTRKTSLGPASPPVAVPRHSRVDQIPRVPLIGQEMALNQLIQQWTAAKLGYGQVIVLSGLAGVGKTRLLEEVNPQVLLSQGRTVSSNCRERTALPYQPIINILDELLLDLPASTRKELPSELVRLLPGSNGASLSDPTTADQAEARQRLFGGCGEVVRQAVQAQASLIVIEDLQWADPATLDLLEYLIEQVAQIPLLLVLSYRSEEVDDASGLATLVYDLDRRQAAHFIGLELLTRDQVACFLEGALGQATLPNWLVDGFYQTTNGNPLFIEETLKALAAEGQIAEWESQGLQDGSIQWTKAAPLSLQLPQNVLALAERRLRQLSSQDRTILTTAAVLGSEFAFSLLKVVADLDENDLLDAIDRLLATYLIEELPLKEGEDRYRFAQEALRQSLLISISQRRKRQMHKHAGDAIERLYDKRQPRYWPRLAHHFGEAGDATRALNYSIMAGEAAARVYANAEAVAHYSRALEVADQAQASEAQLINLYTQRGRSLELSEQYERALHNYEAMGELGRERKIPDLELSALMSRATIYATPNPVTDPQKSQSLSEQALAVARRMGDREAQAKILWNLMLVNIWSLGNYHQAVTYGEESLAIAKKLNLREQMAYTLSDLSYAYNGVQRLPEAQVVMVAARRLWRELDNQPMMATNLNASITSYYVSGDFEDALTAQTKGFRISQAIGNAAGQAANIALGSLVQQKRGDFRETILRLEEMATVAEQAGPFYIFSTETMRGIALGYLGATEQAIAVIRAALDHGGEAPLSYGQWALASLARVYCLSGDFANAETTLSRALTDFSEDEAAFPWATPLFLAEAEIAMAEGNYEKALRRMGEMIAILTRAGAYTDRPDARYLKGRALLALGQPDQAYETLQKARSEAKAIGSRCSLWPVLAALSQIEARRNRTFEAEALRLESQKIIAYIAVHAPAEHRKSFLNLPDVQAVT